MFYGMEYRPGQFRLAFLAVFLAFSLFLTYLLEREKVQGK